MFDKMSNINNGYINGKNRRFKNKESVNYQKTWQDTFAEFKECFEKYDRKTHYFQLTLYWHNPKFYTKKGELASNAGDIDGIIKFTQDGIFKGLGIDDSTVKSLIVHQLPTENNYHTLTALVETNLLNNLNNFNL